MLTRGSRNRKDVHMASRMTHETDPESTVLTGPKAEDVQIEPCGEPCLVQIHPVGSGVGTRHMLGAAPVVIGREGNCDLRIPNRTVSRRHARIYPEGNGHAVADLGSMNGTFVNDVRISSHRLKDGDNVMLGDVVLRFLAGGSVEAAYHREIHRMAVLDSLTGVHNRRYLIDALDRELHRSARYHRPLAFLLFDVDSFKSINDAFGHLAGDFSLRELVGCVREVLRSECVFARYGGEEFAIVLPETTLENGVVVAERIRAQIEKHLFLYEGRGFALTVSVGVATTSGGEIITSQDLIRMADKSLFAAKQQGRNRVVAGPDAVAFPPPR